MAESDKETRNINVEVEFGLLPLMFYQTRPFKKKRRAEDWDIEAEGRHKIYSVGENTFGITPQEGIRLELMCESYSGFQRIPVTESDYGFVMLDTSKISRKPTRTDKQFGNLRLFASIKHSCMSHGYYRFMKRADFSMIGAHGIDMVNLEDAYNGTFYSNGWRSRLVIE